MAGIYPVIFVLEIDMSSLITFSPEYLDVLKKMLKVVADLPNKKHALLIKRDNRITHSSMAFNTLVHTNTTIEHADFTTENNEIGITSLNEFLNYAKAIGYPEKESEIHVVQEKTTKHHEVRSFMFQGGHATYRMPVADITAFRKDYDRKMPIPRKKDPMDLVGKFILDADDLKRLVNDIQLMGKLDTFGLSIANNKIIIYMKNIQNQQVTKVIDPTKTKVYNDFTTIKPNDKVPCKLFPYKIFNYMSYFGCDFEIELRNIKRPKTGDIMAVKGFGKLDLDLKAKKKRKVKGPSIKKGDKKTGNVPDKPTDPPEKPKAAIHVYVGTQENAAHACSANMYDIIR